jgi:hypothetical protein
VIGWLAPIDIPMSIRNGMGLRPGFDGGHEKFDTVFRLDSFEIGAVFAQITEERFVIGLNALPDDRNSERGYGS